MTKIISFLNHKGGVAKTTTCANLATALWILGKKVLIIDTDQQCNLSGVLGFSQKEGDPTLSEWLKEPVPAPIYIRYDGLEYIPASKALRNMEAELLNKRSRETILARKLEQVKAEYDYVVIDCAPGNSVLNDNAMSASDSIIIPTECSGFPLQDMQNLLIAGLETGLLGDVEHSIRRALGIDEFRVYVGKLDNGVDFDNRIVRELTQEEKDQYNFLVAKNLTDRWKVGYTRSFDGKYENVYTQYQLTEHMNITLSQNEDHDRRYSVEYRITF